MNHIGFVKSRHGAVSACRNEQKGDKMSGKNQYVVRNGNGWGVRGEGNSRLTASFATQAQAIDRGRDIARNQGAELRIQGSNGQFREAWSYGHDPYPPKG
jgi:Uncharacterized protein conserved in bacteria (DUF2188)